MKKNFNIFNSGLVLLFILLIQSSLSAQLSGSYSIPGSPFATISAAVDSLNQVGVGSGGVTFNVTAGYTEIISDSIGISITATSGNTITFQKSGIGSNPLITRTDAGWFSTSTSGGAGDAVIRMNGTDYITFDGIDVSASDQGIEYGYLTHKPDGTDGCQFVTIKNCIVTMTKGTSAYVMGIYIGNGTTSTSSATGVVVSTSSGRNTNITITGNTIQNVHSGIYVRGATAMHDSIVVIGQSGEGNIIQNYGGGASSTAYGTYFIYVDDPSVAYNTYDNAGGGGSAHNATLYTVFFSSGVSGDLTCSNNAMTVTNAAASSSTYFIYSANSLISETVENNTFASTGTLPSGTLYFIYLSNTTPNKIINNNTTLGTFNKAGGTTYCYYNAGSPTSGLETITNNIFSNINVASGSSTFYGIYSNTASGQARIMTGNTISNVNSSSTGSHYFLYAIAAGNSQVSNNLISNVSGDGTVYGLYAGGTNAMIFNNTVAGVTSTTTGTSICYGAYSTTGTDVTWYNNFFSDIKAPNSTSTIAGTRGFYISSGTNVNLYYNTLYLDYTGIAGNNSAALYATTSPTSIDLRNNIFVNNVDNTAGGNAFAIYGGSLTDLAPTTNNNLYYAGVPSSTNLIYYDGTNTAQTLGDYKTLVTPLESASVSSIPPFINVSTTPYDLHISTTIPTQTESGGTPVVGITDDFDGDTRNATTPDIGADEFNGIGADLTPPTIAYNLLPNISATETSVSLTATITDASGIATGTNLPRFYIKKSTDTSYVFDNNPGISGDDYMFNINYSSIGGIAVGDTIEYYIAAQDLNDNIGTVPDGGSGINPPGTTPPPTPNTYLVVDVPLSGTYTVGLAAFKNATGKNIYFETMTRTYTKYINAEDATEDMVLIDDITKTEIINQELAPKYATVTETYTELMENGKPFNRSFYHSTESLGIYPTITEAVNDLVLRGVSGPVTFLLVDNYYPNETYPILLGEFNGASSTNTVTIKPSTGIQTEIPGNVAQVAASVQVGYGDWYIIDGSNNGTTSKDLKIVGLATGTIPSIHLYGDASNNVFKNLIVESQNPSTGSGSFLFGSGPFASDNNLVENCTIKPIDTIATRPGVGVYFFSSNTGTGNQIVGCDIFDFDDYGLYLRGAPTTNTLVSGCDVYMTDDVSTSTTYGIYINRVDGLIVEKSKFRNLNGGTTIRGAYVLGNSASGDFIFRNNFFSPAASTNSSSAYAGLDYFGFAANSFEAYYNSIYLGGSDVTGSSTTYALTKRDDANIYKAFNNAVYSARSNGTGTGTHYAVYISDTITVDLQLDNNDYFVDGVGGVLGFYQGPGNITDLATWQSTTGLDVNSISGNPGFIGSNDLHIQTNVSTLNGKATPLASVTDDIDGDPRDASTPDIGADEYIFIFLLPAPTNLVAIPDTFTVDLGWMDNSGNELGFVVERKDGDSLSANPFVPIDTVGMDVINYLDMGLNPNTTYTYRIFAYNIDGNSDYSNLAVVTTFIPVELSSFTADVSGREVMIKWITATELNNSGFDIERSMNGEWEQISFVGGKGTTTEESYYSYTDKFTYESFVGTISYRLKQMDFDGTYSYSPVVEVNVDFTPKEYTLYQNYPNPFNPSTTIKYSLPFDSNVRIAVYNVLGELLDVLVDQTKEVGFHDLIWNASNLASGIYIYTIEAKAVSGEKNYSSVKKMILMK